MPTGRQSMSDGDKQAAKQCLREKTADRKIEKLQEADREAQKADTISDAYRTKGNQPTARMVMQTKLALKLMSNMRQVYLNAQNDSHLLFNIVVAIVFV